MTSPCACMHHDRYECYVLRLASFYSNRDEVEEQADQCGGCECDCHDDYDEDYSDN